MRGSQGGYTYNQVQASNGNFKSMTAQSTFLSNASTNILETHFSGPPRLSANQAIQQVTSSYFVQDASFFRCDNISLGYNIGEIVKGRLTGRVNFTIQNAFLFTPYKGIDPEQGGIDNNFYPRPRTYVVGLAFDFK
jgi:iron complex outermembrane receptor protein